jgi:cell division septum initiation protein DivIVA
MAKATRKAPIGVGLSRLLKETENDRAKEIAILKKENDFLKEQLKDCREQLAYTQSIVTSSLSMQQKIIDAFPEKPKKMAKASNKLTIEDAIINLKKSLKIED